MGPMEWVLGVLSPLTDALSLDTDWLGVMAANIIAITSFLKRALGKNKWAVWVITGVFGLIYSGTQYWGNWGALAGSTFCLVALTAGMLYATGSLGKKANKMVPLGAGQTRKG